ncbi:DegV family protein [Chloroflexota bacterium]
MTQKVAIVTDTTACIPQEQVAKYDIEVVPVQLIFEDKVYRDGLDISPSEFYALLRQAKKLPTTSASSPGPYLEAYRKASQRAKSILCITLSAKLSAIFNSARLAMKTAKAAIPKVTIKVLDCGTAAAASGENLNEVIETAQSTMSRVSLFATLDTLQYLVRSGRVPAAAALVNSLLKIKPIFTLNYGDAHTVALPRTIPSAMKRMLKMMGKKVIKGQPLHVAVMHADALDNAIELRNQISSRFDCTELFITEFTPVMGVHTGPGLLGVAFYSGD